MTGCSDYPPIDVKARYTIADYRLSLRAAVRGLWRGEYDLFAFVDSMQTAITRGFKAAWDEGAAQCGIGPEDYTEQEFIELDDRINGELLFVPDFGRAIEEGSKTNGGLLRPQLTRVELWVKRYHAVRSRAMVLTCRDKKLAWRYEHEARHCGDCIRLDGQVRRASVWQEADLEPNSPRLECVRSAGGVSVCKCHFEVTDEPCTRGPLPTVHGAVGSS